MAPAGHSSRPSSVEVVSGPTLTNAVTARAHIQATNSIETTHNQTQEQMKVKNAGQTAPPAGIQMIMAK